MAYIVDRRLVADAPRRVLKRVRVGLYATKDWRYVLEKRGAQWKLSEQGSLLCWKPAVGRTTRIRPDGSHPNNGERDAVRWAHAILRGEAPISRAVGPV